jgi:hypothetical protein
MKDAFGHGSNSNGVASLADVLRSRLPGSKLLRGNDGGGQPVSSNAAAGEALASTLKSTQAPAHPAMAMQSGNDVVHQFRDGPRGSRSFGEKPITNLKGSHH